MDELALISEAKRGSLEAFNRLVLEYQDLVYYQAYRLTGEQELAADASQEAFLSAYRHIQSFRGGSFRAWLLRIVTNVCYDEIRRRKRRPTSPLEPVDDTDEEIESPYWIADNSYSPEEAAMQKELSLAIQRCLEQLPEEFLSVVVLVDLQDIDYAEAAQVIGKPIGTVKSRLARARLRLRDCLQGYWELLPVKFRQVEESTP